MRSTRLPVDSIPRRTGEQPETTASGGPSLSSFPLACPAAASSFLTYSSEAFLRGRASRGRAGSVGVGVTGRNVRCTERDLTVARSLPRCCRSRRRRARWAICLALGGSAKCSRGSLGGHRLGQDELRTGRLESSLPSGGLFMCGDPTREYANLKSL